MQTWFRWEENRAVPEHPALFHVNIGTGADANPGTKQSLNFQVDFPERGENFNGKVLEIKHSVRDEKEIGFKLTEGPDEVCSVCPAFDGKGCSHPDGDDREVRKWDRVLLKTFDLDFGDVLSAEEIKKILAENYPIAQCKRCPLPRKKMCDPYKGFQ